MRSSAGTYTACTEVIDQSFVEVILSCSAPISVASVGWYHTAEGILQRSADISEPACVNLKILSTKSSTSFFSLSLKCSAIVRPVSATLALGPGASFICPNTIAVLSITPDSFISWYRSFHSLVLSPTQATTEYHPWPDAILWISSCMITVLPTHAHPKRPTFQPFSIGAIKSTTLIPVSKSSAFVVNSVNSGASLWIGSLCSAFGAGFPSIGSPSTLNILPRTASPTGVLIGDPVVDTSNPLWTPSIGFIAIVLTTPSPNCCCVSRTIFSPSGPFSSRAS